MPYEMQRLPSPIGSGTLNVNENPCLTLRTASSFSRATFLWYSFRMMLRDICSLCSAADSFELPPVSAFLPAPATPSGLLPEGEVAGANPVNRAAKVTDEEARSSSARASCTLVLRASLMPREARPAMMSRACGTRSLSSSPSLASAGSVRRRPLLLGCCDVTVRSLVLAVDKDADKSGLLVDPADIDPDIWGALF